MAHIPTAHDGDGGAEDMIPMSWSAATNSSAAVNVPQQPTQQTESQSLKLNLKSRIPSHSTEEGGVLPVLSPKTPNLMPEYPELLQYGQSNAPELVPTGMEALDSFGAVTSNVVYSDNNVSTEGFPQSFQTVEHISPLPGDIHGVGLTPVDTGPAPGSLFVQSKDGSGLSTIVEHQRTESLSPRGMTTGYGPVSPGYQAFVSAEQPPLTDQQPQPIAGGFPAGMGFGSPQVSTVAKTESSESKQSSALYQKPRGSRKKTLSLNPEEREALENLIEEVLIDGVADSDEASISSDGDEEGSNSGKEQKQTVGGAPGSKDAAGKEGMPKIYPAQLKVAVKHMRNLPPRFMRRLENAQKKIDAAEKQELDKAREEQARAESEAIQREQVRIRFREDQKREKKKEIRNLLDDLDQYTDEQSVEKISEKKEKSSKGKSEGKKSKVFHASEKEEDIQESTHPVHVGLSKNQGNVKPQTHDITNELAQKLLGQKLVSGPLPPAIQPNAVNCEDLERQFLGEPAVQMDSGYCNQPNIARHMAPNHNFNPYGYGVVQNMTEQDQRTHLSVDAPEFVPFNSFGAISSHISVAQPSQYMPVPGSQMPAYTSSPVIHPDPNPHVPSPKVHGSTFKPVSKDGAVKPIDVMRTKSSSPFQAPLGRHSPQAANAANVGRLSPQVVASSTASGQPLHLSPSSLASDQVPHNKNAPYMLSKIPTNIPPPTTGVPPPHGVGVMPMNPYPVSYNLPGFHHQGYPLRPPFLPPHGYVQWPGDGGLDKQGSAPLVPHPLMGIPLKASPQMGRKRGGHQHHGQRQPGPRHPTPNKVPPSDVKVLTNEAAHKLVQQLLTDGIKVMVILRGCAGSGKSTLARDIVFDGVCLSTDEFFINPQGEYVYDFGKLGEAHAWNQNRAKQAVESGKNPVIIDNTNTQAWEMKVYVNVAKNNGYHVEIVEPDTLWRHNAKELAKRNTHGVTLEAIRKMLDRYEHNVTLQSITGVPIKKPEEADKLDQSMDGETTKKTPRRRKKKKRKRNRRRDKPSTSEDGQTKEGGPQSSDESSEDEEGSSKSTTPSLPPVERTASLSNTEHEMTSSPRDTTPEVAERGIDSWGRKVSDSLSDTERLQDMSTGREGAPGIGSNTEETSFTGVPAGVSMQGDNDGHNDNASNQKQAQNSSWDSGVNEENESLKERTGMNGMSQTTATSEDNQRLLTIINGLRILDEMSQVDNNGDDGQSGDDLNKNNSESKAESDSDKPVINHEQCVSSEGTSDKSSNAMQGTIANQSENSENVHCLSSTEISHEVAQVIQEEIMEAIVKQEFKYLTDDNKLDNVVGDAEAVEQEQSELPDVHTDSEDDSRHKDGLSDIHHSLEDIGLNDQPYEADLDIDLDSEYGIETAQNVTDGEVSIVSKQMQESDINSQPVHHDSGSKNSVSGKTETSYWENTSIDIYSVAPNTKHLSTNRAQDSSKDPIKRLKDEAAEASSTSEVSLMTMEDQGMSSSSAVDPTPKPRQARESHKWSANSESESNIWTEDEPNAVGTSPVTTEISAVVASKSPQEQDQTSVETDATAVANASRSTTPESRYPFVVRHDLDPQRVHVIIKEKVSHLSQADKVKSAENLRVDHSKHSENNTNYQMQDHAGESTEQQLHDTIEKPVTPEIVSHDKTPVAEQSLISRTEGIETSSVDTIANLQSNPHVRPKVRTYPTDTCSSLASKKSNLVKPDVREKLLNQDWNLPKNPYATSSSNSSESLKLSLVPVKTAPMSTQTSPRDYSFVQKLQHCELDAVLVMDEYNIQGILQSQHVSSIQTNMKVNSAADDSGAQDSVSKRPFREKFHKGCQTVEPELPESEDPDLEEKVANLQMCFPEVSREDLFHILHRCNWDVEWASNILLDGGGIPPKPEPSPEEVAVDRIPPEGDDVINDVHGRFEVPTEEPQPLQKYKSVSSLEDTSLELTVCPSKSIFDDKDTYEDFSQPEATVTHDPPPLAVICHEKLISQETTSPEDDVLEQMANTSLDRLRSIEEFHHQHLSSSEAEPITQELSRSPDITELEKPIGLESPASTSHVSSSVSQLDNFRLPPPVSRRIDSPQRAASPKKLPNGMDTSEGMNLRLTPQIAHQLIKMFGPVQVPFAPVTLADEDLNVWLDKEVAQKIHKSWADTLLSKLADTESENIQDDTEKKRLEDDEALARQLQEEEYKLAKQNSMGNNTNAQVHTAGKKHIQKSIAGSRSSSIAGSTHSSREGSPAKQYCPSPAKVRTRESGLLSSRESSPVKYHTPVSSLSTSSRPQEPPPSLRDIMNEEMALEASRLEYLSSQDEVKENEGTISTRLKWQQLTEHFPGMDPQLLDEVFQSTGYNLESTIHTIETTMDQQAAPRNVMTQEAAARFEEQMFRQAVEESLQQWPDEELPTSESLYQTLEEPAYDDFRAEAKMHFKLRQECFEKAASAYKSGMKDVASFYSQQGHLHSEKLRQANHRAAEKIVELKNFHIENTNILDLHGLHVDEAILTLERILAKRETEQRENPDKRKNMLSVVTGRGNRSRGGVPKIRPAVTEFLRTNNYKWTEPTASIIKVHLKYRFL